MSRFCTYCYSSDIYTCTCQNAASGRKSCSFRFGPTPSRWMSAQPGSREAGTEGTSSAMLAQMPFQAPVHGSFRACIPRPLFRCPFRDLAFGSFCPFFSPHGRIPISSNCRSWLITQPRRIVVRARRVCTRQKPRTTKRLAHSVDRAVGKYESRRRRLATG